MQQQRKQVIEIFSRNANHFTIGLANERIFGNPKGIRTELTLIGRLAADISA